MMNQDIAGISSNLDTTVKAQQFDKVVEAIIAGKYSWACVLMLRFAGYNPLHYIPYRTYNRLLKENSQTNRTKQQQSENIKMLKDSRPAYLEVVGKQKPEGSQDISLKRCGVN